VITRTSGRAWRPNAADGDLDRTCGCCHRCLREPGWTTLVLHALGGHGVSRHGRIPRRVDYALTPLGLTLQHTVMALCGWVVENMPEVRAAQAAFDADPQVGAPWQQASSAGRTPG